MSRRTVLAGAGAVAGTAAMGGVSAANEPGLRVGVVGAGWFGKVDCQALMQVAPVDYVAYADPDSVMVAGAAKEALELKRPVRRLREDPKIYRDYRQMFAENEFDIVLVDTPDHWHALPMIEAVQAGAHVYVQKPICVDVAEGRAMVAAAQNSDRVVQVGLQRRTQPHLIEAKRDIIGNGKLGTIGHVEVFGYFHQRPSDFGEITKPPSTLDWDLFVGPAPMVPYRPGIHPRDWRAFEEFSNGFMGDIGVHFIDCVRWLLDLGWPKSIYSAAGTFVDPDSIATVPDTQAVNYLYNNLLLTWTNRVWGRAPKDGWPWGAAIHGSKGSLWVSTGNYEFVPQGGGETITQSAHIDYENFPHERDAGAGDALTNTTNRAQMRDFMNAINKGTPLAAPIEEGFISTALCSLANISAKVGRVLNIDPESGELMGDEEARQHLLRPYRAPFKHPGA